MGCVILSTLVAPLVPRIRPPTKRSLLELAAGLVAVAMAPVIRPADDESPAAPAATKSEDNELVHPARKDENWTATSSTMTVPRYWLSIRRLYMRVQAPTWALLRFSAVRTYRAASRRATSWCPPPLNWPVNRLITGANTRKTSDFRWPSGRSTGSRLPRCFRAGRSTSRMKKSRSCGAG
jgi:hypothetical protein